MSDLTSYISTAGSSPVSLDAIRALVVRYPWFTAARCVVAHLSCEDMPIDTVLREARNSSSLDMQSIDVELLTEETEGEIIDRFLRLDDYRIVAEDSGVEEDIMTEAEFDDDDDLVSEDLAEVYLAQGLKMQAVEIYRKLSLLNPEKSIYFAKKIEKLEKQ